MLKYEKAGKIKDSNTKKNRCVYYQVKNNKVDKSKKYIKVKTVTGFRHIQLTKENLMKGGGWGADDDWTFIPKEEDKNSIRKKEQMQT